MELPDLNSEIVFSTSRSSGSGGQNVNKVETKVELRFNIQNSKILTLDQKKILLEKLSKKLNQLGELIITCQDARSQLKNREIVEKKFNALLAQSLVKPKKRIATKATQSSKEERKLEKERNSKLKTFRGNLKNKNLKEI
ncbi:MAG: hypothetical protein RLZZ546_2735 [Bacteroidota bacterium]